MTEVMVKRNDSVIAIFAVVDVPVAEVQCVAALVVEAVLAYLLVQTVH